MFTSDDGMGGTVYVFFSCETFVSSLAAGTLLERGASVTSRQPPRAADSPLFLLNLCRPLATASSALLTPTVVQIRFATHNSLRPRLRLS